MQISCIVAADENNGIGYHNHLLWHLPKDLLWFKKKTLSQVIVMGRKTFESFPGGPLKNRQHWVLTRSSLQSDHPQVLYFQSIKDIFKCAADRNLEQLIIVGGSEVYALFLPYVTRLWMTRVETMIAQVDAFFPKIDLSKWRLVNETVVGSDDRHAFSFKCQEYERALEKNWQD